MRTIIAEVIINRVSKRLNKTFSYIVPEKFASVKAGTRCLVSFAGKHEEGIILSITDADPDQFDYKLQYILDVMDTEPWFTEQMLLLAYWIAAYYMCPLIEALRLFLIDKVGIQREYTYEILWDNIPAGSEFSSLIDHSVKSLHEKDAELIFGGHLKECLDQSYLIRRELLSSVHAAPVERWIEFVSTPKESDLIRSSKQKLLWGLLKTEKAIPVRNLKEQGISDAVVRAYCNKGFAKVIYKAKDTYSLITDSNTRGNEKNPTEEQFNAINEISKLIDKSSYEGVLLKGVTGSGKTEVYLQCAKHALEKGGSALILVPEISLTNQLTSYFASVFGDDVVFMHSKLSKGEKYNNRQRIVNGESRIIIGSRSALFLPFKNLKLIVVDEEYESSYKQGESPRYNGRDVAKMMAKISNCPIVLGAATPSIATYYAALSGKIRLIELKHRVFNTPLPKILIYDMRGDYSNSGRLISMPLRELLEKTLENKRKAILLLNKRGFASTLICSSCGYVFKCPNCDVSFVYHKEENLLKCHYCGTTSIPPYKCPKCGNRKIRYLGWGTELIEKELKEDFPQARSQRFDLDSTSRKNSAQRILNDFKNDKIDILFGTQMVAKGHDIPNVNTVGILSADSILNMPTYLAAEQTFNLITQCAGRAGRGKERGEVILQTYNPEHYVIETAARQDYEKFYEQEVEFRKMLGYPPFLKLLKITCFNKDYNTAVNQANTIYRFLCEANKNLKAKVSFTEPFPEPIKRVRNLYFISILIKGSNFVDLKNLMRNSVIFKENDIIIDVDPI